MKNLSTKNYLSFLLLSFIVFQSHGQQWQWAKAVNMPFGINLRGVQLCNEASGNFYLTGYNWDSNNGYPNGSCIIKFDNAGNELWRKTLNDKIRVLRIHPDNSGNILIAGDFRDTIQLNGISYMAQKNNDGFLASLSQSGATNWFKKIAGPGDESAQDIYCDNNNLFLTGQFSNSTTIDGNILNTSGVGSTYVLKCGIAGNYKSLITANTLDATGYNSGYRFQKDATGNLYVLGNYNQIQIASSTLTDGNPYNAQYLAKLDSSGQLQFLNHIIGGTERFKNFKITNDELYFTGDGGWTSGGWTKTEKYDNSGTKLWSKSKTGFYYEYSSNSLENDNTGVYTIGYEGNPNVPQWNTTYALMLSHFNNTGQENCTYVNSVGRVEGSDICKATATEYLITGHTPDTITFGSTVLKKSDGNIFIARFMNPGMPTTLSSTENTLSQVKVVPNPSTGEFNIQLPEDVKEGTYIVYDIAGKKIFDLPLNPTSDRQVIDLTGKTKGIYFLEINTGKQKTTKKLVLR
jgi:hypothetical protein